MCASRHHRATHSTSHVRDVAVAGPALTSTNGDRYQSSTAAALTATPVSNRGTSKAVFGWVAPGPGCQVSHRGP